MFSRRSMLAAAGAAPWFAPAALRAQAVVPPTLEELLRAPTILDAALSPDGKRVAVLHEHEIKGERTALVMLRRETGKPVAVIIGDYRVEQVEWANDERLLVWLLFDKTSEGDPTGLWIGDEFFPIPVRGSG